jgi:zinc transporter 1/2/3
MVRESRPLSDLHTKGLLTLCLLILAESVSFTNAVTFWNSYQTWSRQHRAEFEEGGFARAASHAQECSNSGTCESTHTPPPAKVHPRSRIAKRVTTIPRTPQECCMDCSDCVSDEDAVRMCNIPRGGHIHDHTEHVERIVEAVASAPAPYGIPLNGWKVIFQAFLTALNVFCWLVPLKSKKMSQNKLALSLANAFSGGVFLTLAFGHLIPECIHGFDGFNEVTPFMLVLGGYLLIFFVEKVAFDTHDLLHVMEHKHDKEENGHSPSATSSGRGAVILLGALAVHSILEMMALGLADNFGDCAILTISIALHQVRQTESIIESGHE